MVVDDERTADAEATRRRQGTFHRDHDHVDVLHLQRNR